MSTARHPRPEPTGAAGTKGQPQAGPLLPRVALLALLCVLAASTTALAQEPDPALGEDDFDMGVLEEDTFYLGEDEDGASVPMPGALAALAAVSLAALVARRAR